jgi:hypothetical protein
MPRSKLLWWDSTLSGKNKNMKKLKKRPEIVHLYIFIF